MDRRSFTVIRPMSGIEATDTTVEILLVDAERCRQQVSPVVQHYARQDTISAGDQSLSVMAMLYPMSELDAKGNKAGLMTNCHSPRCGSSRRKAKGKSGWCSASA